MSENTGPQPVKGLKRPWLAALLNLPPATLLLSLLLIPYFSPVIMPELRLLGVLLAPYGVLLALVGWFGYLYLVRWRRFFGVGFMVPALSVFAGFLVGEAFLPCPYPVPFGGDCWGYEIGVLYYAALAVASVFFLASAFTARDAWRLAKHNARLLA